MGWSWSTCVALKEVNEIARGNVQSPGMAFPMNTIHLIWHEIAPIVIGRQFVGRAGTSNVSSYPNHDGPHALEVSGLELIC